jgi:hypothetical protein
MESKTKKREKKQKEEKPPIHDHQSKTVHPPPPGYVPPPGTSDIIARLENLKELLDKKLVTKEEYEKKRKEIISQL